MKPTLLLTIVLPALLSPIIWPASSVQAQTGAHESEALREMTRAYESLDYARADSLGQALLASPGLRSPAELYEIHTLLGVLAYSRGDEDAAHSQFQSAISLRPAADLDSLRFSPKIVEFFRESRRLARLQPTPVRKGPLVIYKWRDDPRSAAALRSLVFPGWGQLHKGERKRGLVLAVTTGVVLSGLAISQSAMESAHSEYRDMRLAPDIERAYDKYRRRYYLRSGFALALAGVWAYSYFDALTALREPGGETETSEATNLQFSFAGLPTLHLSFHF